MNGSPVGTIVSVLLNTCYKQMRGLGLWLLFTVVAVTTFAAPVYFNSTFTAGQQFITGQINIAAQPNNRKLAVTFQVLNRQLSSTLAVLSLVGPIPPSGWTKSSIIGKKSSDAEGADLEGMRIGRIQYLTISKAAQTSLYYTILNYNPIDRQSPQPSFYLKVDDMPNQLINNCPPCFKGTLATTAPVGQSCLCNGCPKGFTGAGCDMSYMKLSADSVSTIGLIGPSILFYVIKEDNPISFTVASSNDQVEMSLLSFTNPDDIGTDFASFTRVSVNPITSAELEWTIVGTQGFSLKAGPVYLSITLTKYSTQPTLTSISYSVIKESNVLIIVLAVVGSILLVFLIGCAIFMFIRSRNSQNNQIHSISGTTQPTRLADAQIEQYFPSTSYSQLAFDEKYKSDNNNAECAICQCPFLPDEPVKTTYCKHLFHGNCLVSWFHKNMVREVFWSNRLERQEINKIILILPFDSFLDNMNCPYCRHDFSRDHVSDLYSKLVKANGNVILMGTSLCKAMLNQNNQRFSVDNEYEATGMALRTMSIQAMD